MPGVCEGMVAIVTGGGNGIGRGIAQKLKNEGAQVVIADIDRSAGERSAQEIGCFFHETDVTKRSNWESLKTFVDGKFGRLDAVVNNAGTTYRRKASIEVEDEEFDKVYIVNVKSVHLCMSVLIPYVLLKGVGASFISVASTAGIRPRPGLTWYNASKAAIINASRTLALEYAKANIRFNTVCPVIALGTGLTDLFVGQPENMSAMMSIVPLGRACTPRDIANVCAFLCSKEAEFLTGIDIPVDGGRCA